MKKRSRKGIFFNLGSFRLLNFKKVPDQKQKKQRLIDKNISRVSQSLPNCFVLASKTEIKAWKAFAVVVFAAGFAAALVWSAYNKWYIESGAKGKKASLMGGLSVSVDYGKKIGNLTEALENILGDAGIESYAHHLHMYAPNKERVEKLGFQHFRLINVEPNKPDLNACASFNFAGLSRLNNLLDYAEEFNVAPHIIIGDYQKLPDQLTNDWNNVALWNKYDNCIEGFFKYIAGKDIKNVVWEVGNEPDVDGSPNDYERYAKVYQHISDIAKKAEADTGKKITMGGPSVIAVSYCPQIVNRGGWHKRFLEDAMKNNWKLDFVSFHFYGSQASFGGRRDVPQTYAETRPCLSFEDTVKELRGFIKETKPGTPIWVTEWGASFIVDKCFDDKHCPDSSAGGCQKANSTDKRYCSADRPVNSNYVGAAAHAALIGAMVTSKVDKASILELTNISEDLSFNSYPALFFTNKNSFEKCKSNGYACWIPEATYYVFEMFSELQKGHLLETSDASSSIGSLAAKKSDGGFSAILWNYDWKRDNMYMAGSEASKEERINFKVEKLPENSMYKAKGTLVSEKYGDNYAALIEGTVMDEANIPSKPLEQDFGTIVSDGGTASLDIVLPPSSVMFLEFSPLANPAPIPPSPESFCGDGQCQSDEDCTTCSQDCGACVAPISYSPPEVIVGGKAQVLSASEPIVTKAKSVIFRGTLKNIPRGKVRIFQDGKRIKIKNLPKSGKWQAKIPIKKAKTFAYQFRYYDKKGGEVFVSDTFSITKTK